MTSVLLVTSNGTGMGHLSRQLAVALSLPDTAEPTIFSLSVAAPSAAKMGVAVEYGQSHHLNWFSPQAWHRYLRDRLHALVDELGASVVSFDGVSPYPGLIRAATELSDVAWVWQRRGMWRPGSNTTALDRRGYFDLVIEPGDLAAPADIGPTSRLQDALRVAPISLLSAITRLDRAQAAAELGIDADRPTALVTLGSGMLGNVAGPGGVTVDELSRSPEWQICVTKPSVAHNHVPTEGRGDVAVLSGVFPLVRYLNAFDVAVSAAGYNAVHELLPAGIPTLLIPNRDTVTDDQVSRAGYLAEAGLALTAPEDDEMAIRAALARLLSTEVTSEVRATLAGAATDVAGAQSVGERLAMMSTNQPAAPTRKHVPLGMRAKEAARAVLGEQGTDMVRRLLGREVPRRDSVARMVVTTRAEAEASANPILFTEALDDIDLSANYPIEHLLRASSAGYRDRRRRIAEAFYRIGAG